MDEVQLGDALVREGYRLSCQCRVADTITVQVSPPVDDQSFQILGSDRPAGAPVPVTIDARVSASGWFGSPSPPRSITRHPTSGRPRPPWAGPPMTAPPTS